MTVRSSSFQLAIVNQTLVSDGDRAIVLADGGLVKDWVKSKRLVVIVQSNDAHALFIYNAKNLPVNDKNDLSLNHVLPIDGDFK